MLARGTRIKIVGCGLLAAGAFMLPLATQAQAARAAGDAPLATELVIAGGAPALPYQPPTVPTPDPPGYSWRIHLGAFPDTVGVGGYACQGCDGVFSNADRAAAAALPLQPLMVVITEPGNPQNTYWVGRLDRTTPSQQTVGRDIVLPVPPPYQVNLITVNPIGYTVCPNSRPLFIVTQDDFDAVSGSRPGAGRDLRHDWFFWSCRSVRPEL